MEYGAWWDDTGENQSNRRKTYPNATMFTTNSTWTGLGLNSGLRVEAGGKPRKPWHDSGLSSNFLHVIFPNFPCIYQNMYLFCSFSSCSCILCSCLRFSAPAFLIQNSFHPEFFPLHLKIQHLFCTSCIQGISTSKSILPSSAALCPFILSA